MSQLQAWVKELQAENVALKISAPSQCLLQIQEPAVNQQLTTEQEPVWGQSRFHGQPWMSCAAEHVTMVLADQRYAAEGYEARYLYAAPVLAAQPEDPMDWRLPCDVTVGGGTIGKGCRLGTLVLRMKVLYKMATGEDADEVAARTVEQRTEFLAALRQQAATEPQAAPAAVAVPDAVRDALLQSEAALEVATARILKADPDHSISVTSEAKALVAVRAALAATPAADAQAQTIERQRMTAGRASFFMERFLREEKLLGPNEQAALHFVIDMLEAAAPAVLPEPDAVIKEVMRLIADLECEAADVGYGHGSQRLVNEKRAAIESKMRALLAGVSAPAGQAVAFQQRVQPWMMGCFGPEISADRIERNHRFLEEALELVQSCGCTASEAHQLVDYVFGRPLGEPVQEAGGVMVTLAALCLANGLDMHECGETELARIWTKVEAIRAKQAAKPKHSPLPMLAPQAQDVGRGEVLVTVSGFTGSGKSAIAGEIEILCRALGLQVDWPGGDSEKNMTHADWTAALEQYKPRVRIVEHNVPTSESKNDH
ncbi:hypothetical protein [Comamonas sp. 26]|uniref:hypothetical protein n=1 Tax=Comamonas sp. 26 TaxID=2035201 RepID=UPI001E324BE0|nr:hypothetical protein [Comamonas sp. 26]